MTIIALIPVLMAVAGALVFLLAKNSPKLSEIGRCVMFAGLLAFALTASKSVMKIGAASEPDPSASVGWAASDVSPSYLRPSASS